MADTAAERASITRLVDDYARSITDADIDLAARVWSTSGDASFIHPKGDHRGWERIWQEFYLGLMRDKFSRRHLRIYDLDIQIYDGLAVVLFYWEFNATRQDDGTPHKTEGRETQVFRFDGQRWLLVHIHYSNMPVAGEREGF